MKVLKVYKHKRGKSRYKERCPICNTKLLIDYNDLHFTNGEVLDYHYTCPICNKRLHLVKKNDKKMWEYREYTRHKIREEEA